MKLIVPLVLLVAFDAGRSQPAFVTTIHPFREIVRMVVGDRGEVYEILPAGASPHTFELRPSEIRRIAAAKALFCGSPQLDGWSRKFQNPHRLELLQLLPPQYRLRMEGHRSPAAPGSSGIDPHFWTDPLAVKALLPSLADTLCALDSNGCEVYQQNSARAASHLDSLVEEIDRTLAPVRGAAVVLSHPFFRYFLKRFGIRVAAVIEWAPGREPTPKDIKRIIQQVKREKVQAIFTLAQLSSRPAELVAEASGVPTHELDPLGGVPGRMTYDELMLHNMRIILEALR